MSLFGTVWCLCGVCLAISGEDIVAGIILTVVGVACFFLANLINERAVFRKWIKHLKKQGITERLANSEEICIEVYNANPCKKTIKYIRKYNPAVADKLLTENKKSEKIKNG